MDKKVTQVVPKNTVENGCIFSDVKQVKPVRKPTPYERTRAAVYATGNKWAIENFEATH